MATRRHERMQQAVRSFRNHASNGCCAYRHETRLSDARGTSVTAYAAESGKDKLEIWNVMPFPKPVKLSAIKAHLTGGQAWRAKRALSGGHVSSGAFGLLLKRCVG